MEAVSEWVGLRTQRATFMPKRTDTLRPEARKHVGTTYLWRAQWVVTEEDGGDYVGQTVWLPEDRDVYFGWVPDEDLSPVLG